MTIRIEAANRWDALALTKQLNPYSWFLYQEDSDQWQVCLQLDVDGDLPDDLRQRIDDWLLDRKLPRTVIRTGQHDYIVTSG